VTHTYSISTEGNLFIRDQIKKSLIFFIGMCIISLALCVVFMFEKFQTIDGGAIFLCALFFLFPLSISIGVFRKAIKLHQHLIKEIDIEKDIITLTGYKSFGKEAPYYTLYLKNYQFEKGIQNLMQKSINTFKTKDTYILIAKEDPNQHFYFISSFWKQWNEIQGLFLNDYLESKAG